VPEIQVLGVKPSWVAQGGNTMVTVYGSNFVNTPEIACRFGKSFVVSAAWVSLSAVTVKVSALRVGTHSVEASLNGVEFASTSAEVEVKATPMVVSASPSTSRITGNKLVELKTWNVDTAAEVKCLFGSATAVATVVSSSRVLCRTAKHLVAEDIRVGLQIADKQVWGEDVFLRYEEMMPSVMGIYPSTGPVGGGTAVKLGAVGLPMDSTGECVFEGADGRQPATIVSSSFAECVAPARAAGVVSVSLMLDDDELVTG
jgi:hypothetical protein